MTYTRKESVGIIEEKTGSDSVLVYLMETVEPVEYQDRIVLVPLV